MTASMYQERGPITVAVDGWRIDVQHGLPASYDVYRRNATLAEEFELDNPHGDTYYLAVTRGTEPWPCLVVAERYEPAGYSFDPGVAFVSETTVLFAGAGSRLLAYSLADVPRRLWEDTADVAFWHWSVQPSAVRPRWNSPPGRGPARNCGQRSWSRPGCTMWSATGCGST